MPKVLVRFSAGLGKLTLWNFRPEQQEVFEERNTHANGSCRGIRSFVGRF